MDKTYQGTAGTDTGDYGDADNWTLHDLVTPIYKWTDSPAQTGEYYLDLLAGGDPGLTAPDKILENAVAMTLGSLGSLAASEYAYGDNDTLGYSTVYVRLADTTDPDLQADGHIQHRAIPKATDDVTLPEGIPAITTGLDQSDVAVNRFINDSSAAVGTREEYLRIDPDEFTQTGDGQAYIDLRAANISPVIKRTASVSGATKFGLYIKGSNLATLRVEAGSVLIDDGTVIADLIGLSGARVHATSGVTTLTDIFCLGAIIETFKTITNGICEAGMIILGGTATVNATLLRCTGGVIQPDAPGTITDATVDKSGAFDFTKSTSARTISNAPTIRGNGKLKFNPQYVTVPAATAEQVIQIGGV